MEHMRTAAHLYSRTELESGTKTITNVQFTSQSPHEASIESKQSNSTMT